VRKNPFLHIPSFSTLELLTLAYSPPKLRLTSPSRWASAFLTVALPPTSQVSECHDLILFFSSFPVKEISSIPFVRSVHHGLRLVNSLKLSYFYSVSFTESGIIWDTPTSPQERKYVRFFLLRFSFPFQECKGGLPC